MPRVLVSEASNEPRAKVAQFRRLLPSQNLNLGNSIYHHCGVLLDTSRIELWRTVSTIFSFLTFLSSCSYFESTMAAEAKAQTDLKNFQDIFSLEGKVVVVTGGSRGLGLHAASGSVISPLSAPSVCLCPCFKQKFPENLLTYLHNSFLQAGCSKVYITSRKAAACALACEALNALPNKRPGSVAISVPADSAKIADVEALVREVEKTTDHVDILFANAGATWGAAFDKHPDEAFAKVMDLNVKSVFNTIRLYVSLSMMCNGLVFLSLLRSAVVVLAHGLI